MAPLLFVPAFGVFVLAVAGVARDVSVGAVATAALAAWLFGGAFVHRTPAVAASTRTLRVATYNLLANNDDNAAMLRTIRATDADLIGLFEIRPPLAALIRDTLRNEYPYQILQPDEGVHGIAAISRFPLTPLTGPDDTLPGVWSATPQSFAVAWPPAPLIWVHAHAHSPGVVVTAWLKRRSLSAAFAWLADRRIESAEALRDFGLHHTQPVVITTDLNATERSPAYATVTNALQDAWREGGWGFGHSWSILRRYIFFPLWVARIDYIFHSRHFQALAAQVGPWDGTSDHRPVVATLALAPSPH